MVLGRSMTEIAPYGTWESPISAADVARGKMSLSFPAIAGDEVWWQEGRPSEDGRTTVMTSGSQGSGARELLPAPWSARTRVHEYGGTRAARNTCEVKENSNGERGEETQHLF